FLTLILYSVNLPIYCESGTRQPARRCVPLMAARGCGMINLTEELVSALASPEAQESIAKIVRDAIRSEREMTAVPEILDVHGAAALLAMTPVAVRKACSRGTLPYSKLGQKLRFSRTALLAIMNSK